MLDGTVAGNTAIVDAMRAWHTTQAQPPAGLGITANAANTVWEITYGYEGDQAGTIRMDRDNFAVTQVTTPGGAFVDFTYNHVWPAKLDLSVVISALSCNALATNDGARSVVILLCSEAARSKLVQRFVNAVLGGAEDPAAYATVRALTAEYGHTQTYTGGQVDPGPNWKPLEIQDHLRYALHQKNDLHVVNQFDGIHQLNSSINPL
jgi:hypothetical protein